MEMNTAAPAKPRTVNSNQYHLVATETKNFCNFQKIMSNHCKIKSTIDKTI